MKSIYVIRYKVRGAGHDSKFVTFAPDFAEALARFKHFTGSQGLEADRYFVIDYYDIPEPEIRWKSHLSLVTRLPDDELRDFLETRKAQQLENMGRIDRTTTNLLNKLGMKHECRCN